MQACRRKALATSCSPQLPCGSGKCLEWAWLVGRGGLRLFRELCQVAPGLGMWLSVSSPSHSPGPRLVFNRVNGRRPPAMSPSLEGTQEPYTLAHEENVRFVSEAWQQVEQQLGGGPAGESGPRPVQYVERTPNPRLQNFVPIDLDEWWAQQFLARITNCS